jgi:hypothetical protein
MRRLYLSILVIISAAVFSGEAEPPAAEVPTLTLDVISSEGGKEIKKETVRKADGLALFDSGGGKKEFPPRGWSETREAGQLELDGKNIDVSFVRWLPDENTKAQSPVREIQLWISAKHKMPQFMIPLPGPDITVPANVVKLHFLPSEIGRRKSEIKGQYSGETEVQISGKTYACCKIKCSLAGAEEGQIEYILSEDIPGKGYSFKFTGNIRGQTMLHEVKLREISVNPK